MKTALGKAGLRTAMLSISMLARALVLPIAEHLQRLVGKRVLSAVERLMGLILVAVAVEMILRAITALAEQLAIV